MSNGGPSLCTQPGESQSDWQSQFIKFTTAGLMIGSDISLTFLLNFQNIELEHRTPSHAEVTAGVTQ